MKQSIHTLVVCSALLASPAASWAAGQQTVQDSQAQNKLGEAGREFVTEAIKGNRGEVLVGSTAQQQGASKQVRDFGEMLVEDHKSANQKLRPIAAANDIDWQAQPKKQAVDLANTLAGMSGEKFDHKFIDEMVKDHQKDIDKYQKIADKTDDPQLRQYVNQTLPTLKKHLETARRIQSESKQAADQR